MNGKAIIANIKERGYILSGDTYYPPTHPEAIKAKKPKRKAKETIIRSCDKFDTRNIRNKAKYCDTFTNFVKQQLGIECYPEFYFTNERQYRLDYAFPDHKIGLEIQGGIWAKGNSGHSSGTGIRRDMDKNKLATLNGWRVISIEPKDKLTLATIEVIKQLMKQTI